MKVFIGAFFLLNLTLAVMKSSFTDTVSKKRKEKFLDNTLCEMESLEEAKPLTRTQETVTLADDKFSDTTSSEEKSQSSVKIEIKKEDS